MTGDWQFNVSLSSTSSMWTCSSRGGLGWFGRGRGGGGGCGGPGGGPAAAPPGTL